MKEVNKNEKILYILVSAIVIMQISSLSVFSRNEKNIQPVISNTEYSQKSLTDKKAIKNYCKEQKIPYDETIIEIIVNDSNNENEDPIMTTFDIIIFEYVIRNKSTYTEIDYNNLVASYDRPAGTTGLNTTVSITNKFSASFSAKIKSVVEVKLGYELTINVSTQVTWSNYYSYPITLNIYPKYEVTTGEVWEDDVWNDDFKGNFTAKRVVGNCVIVRRQ